jgi:hypothetical protein
LAGLLDPFLRGEPLLLLLDGHAEPLAHERSRLPIQGAEVRLDLATHAVQELEDQSALNLELLRKLVNPDLRHPDSCG